MYRNFEYVKTLFLILLFIIIIYNTKKENIEYFTSDEIPTLPRPFVNLYDDKGKKVNVILVSHPFTRDKGTNGTYEQYVEWKNKGINFLGISSYSEFPGMVTNPHDSLSNKEMKAWKDYDYMKLFKGWLHCFRDPLKYINKNVPNILISESDFISESYDINKDKLDKEYDFMYICLKDNDKCEPGWQSHNRNWELAKKCIEIMCGKFNLKGLLVGRVNCELPPNTEHLITIKDFMPKKELIKCYKKSRFLLLPNIVDASPRVLTEALNYNLPALVNYNILGGWKYITNKTGELFNNEYDFEHKLIKLLDNIKANKYEPRKYFTTNYGNSTTGTQLRDFILKHIPNVNFTKNSTKYITTTK
tara:strand:+ start:3700 stop:4779 length:1080 start_codon:yes stop_codon:yes gene_type:complete